MHRRRSIGLVVLSAVSVVTILVGALLARDTPSLLPATVNTPDGSHFLNLLPSRNAGQRFIASSRTLSGFVFWIRDTPSNSQTPIVFTLYQHGANQPLRQITTTITAAEQAYATAMTLRLPPDAPPFPAGVTPLLFDFERVKSARGTTFDAVLTTPEKSRPSVQLAFQIDSTKFPDGSLLVADQERPGDAGFIVFEQPSRLVLLGRWLIHPDHRGIWFGFIALLAGSALSWPLLRRTSRWPAPSRWWQQAWKEVTWQRVMVAAAVILAVTFIVYWPATRLTLFQDDVVKLVRVREFGNDLFKIFFTNHRYLPPGNEPQIPVGFYRPVSFSMLPWVLWHTVGLRPFFYHVSSLVSLALCALGLYLLSLLLLRSPGAALACALVWLVHSTKIGAAFWWSSTEDLMGSLFLIFTIVGYTHLRARPAWRPLLIVFALFTLAVFSKEHAIIFFFIIIPLELFFTRPLRPTLRHIPLIIILLGPLIFMTGIFLTSRVIAINDPTLPHTTQTDKTYAVSLSAPNALRNTVVYSAWTAENWAWRRIGFIQPAFRALEVRVRAWIGPIQAELPYYPGVILIALTLLGLAWLTRSPELRTILLFAIAWWFIMLLPPLLFTAAWGSRWLTLSSWSFALGLVAILLSLLPRPVRAVPGLFVVVCVLAVGYGYWMVRLPERTALYVDLDRVARTALARFEQQHATLTPDSIVYFYDVPHERQGTVNVYLLRLFSSLPFKTTVQTSSKPAALRPHDIIVDIGNSPTDSQ